ncbi:MAG: hypothetical protein H6Q20_1330 [Bacteroidetes bacterium]|jgi:hypothetical protein|nr:hypothetical protein [Bacteroidota bacterium]
MKNLNNNSLNTKTFLLFFFTKEREEKTFFEIKPTHLRSALYARQVLD